MINALIIGGIYLIILFVLSAFLIRKALTSFEDYSYCGRSLGIGFVFFTYLGTWIGGGTIIGLVGRSHDYGASQYWIMAMACFVELFFAFFLIERIRDKEYKSITGFCVQLSYARRDRQNTRSCSADDHIRQAADYGNDDGYHRRADHMGCDSI